MHIGTRRLARWLLVMIAALSVHTEPARAAESSLFVRGYTVIPAPQKVILREAEFCVDSSWRLVLGQAVPPDDVAVEALKQDLNHYRLKPVGFLRTESPLAAEAARGIPGSEPAQGLVGAVILNP